MMRKLLQDYGKQVLAVVSALLMVAFFLPSGMKNSFGGGNAVVGRLGNDKLYGQERAVARQQWDLLTRYRNPYTGQPLAYDVLPFGSFPYSQIEQHQDLFALLIKEAERMGVAVSQDDVEEIVHNELTGITDEDRLDDFRHAIANALLVRNAFLRAASVIKISQPMRQHELAENGQSISVNLVEFDAAKFKSKVPAPTDQQIKEQFNKYKDTTPGNTSATNPFAFGYKYPNRLKLQYIQIPRMEVRRAVEASRDPHRWEVDAFKYYVTHETEFPATQPTSQPANQSFSLETTKKSPTTKPFEEVKNDIRNQLITAETDKLQNQILEHITSSLGGDYMAFHSATNGSTHPTTVPASSLKVPYNTFDYLHALATQIQSTTKVLPVVASLQEMYITPEQVLKINGLGEARVGQENLAAYLDTYTAAFATPDRANDSGLLHYMQPSQTLKDNSGNLYILRITDAQRTHAPESITEVADQVRQDVITKEAFQLARVPAEKLLNESKVDGLRSAANASGFPVITTGSFINRPDATVPNYTLAPDAREQFITGAFDLLITPPAHPGAQPVRVVYLYQANKLDVTELSTVTPIWTANTKYLFTEQAGSQAMTPLLRPFLMSWFDYDSVASRLDYHPEENQQEQQQNQNPAPAPPPIF